MESALEGRAVTNNFLKVVFGANLLFEIELFFFQLVFQRFDLSIRERILHRNRNLLSDLPEQFRVVLRKCGFTQARDTQDAKHPIAKKERSCATRFKTRTDISSLPFFAVVAQYTFPR